MNTKKVAPSLLSADFSCLAQEVTAVAEAGADWLHLDVMDGHFVPNLTFGPALVKSLRPHCQLPFDVHLMVENPSELIEPFKKAGADWITFHIESSGDPKKTIEAIRASGCKVGMSLRPSTPVEPILPFLDFLDLVLVMTVNPGFSGQSFMADQVKKLDVLASHREKTNAGFLLQVDGGINEKTATLCQHADVFVAGNFVFKNDYRRAIEKLKGA